MHILVVVLALVCLGLAFGFYTLERNLKQAKDQLEHVKKGESKARITLQSPNRAAEELFLSMNQLLDLRNAESAAYRRQEHALRQQIANVSHDLRTPLTSILGYLQLLEDESLSPEERRQYLSIIEGRAKTLQSLITAFYDLSRIEGGQWQLEREPVDLARELADQLAAAYEQLEQAGLQVSVKIADGLPPVWGDRNGVVRVLSNLLTNAYRHGTGTLEARLYREGDHVVSAFSNDAPGMTDEDVERVFERFYTVDRMRTGQNTGLGMAIVKALAERMGGQVSARLEDGRFTAQVSWKAAG